MADPVSSATSTVTTFHCDRCSQDKKINDAVGTGYARSGDKTFCYDCCAILDRATMVEDGNSKRLPLYLTQEKDGSYTVKNWPGTLIFRPNQIIRRPHKRYGFSTLVSFAGPDGCRWYGRHVGRWTQIIHCRRAGVKEGVR